MLDIQRGVVGVDIETTIKRKGKISDPNVDRIVAIGISDGSQHEILTDNFERIIPLLRNPDVVKIVQNYAFDGKFFRRFLGCHAVNVWDTLVTERVLYLGDRRPSDLASLVDQYAGVYIEKETWREFANHSGPLTEKQQQYIINDVQYLPIIRAEQLKKVSATALGRVIDLENRVTAITADMELHGIWLDEELWAEYQEWINSRVVEIRLEVAEVLDEVSVIPTLFEDQVELSINLNSTDQVKNLLHDLGIKVKGTDKKILGKLVHEHPFIPLLLEYRKWSRRGTWRYERFIDPVTGKIHPSWNQTGAITGRYSCSDPNGQNIERPKPNQPNFRKAFPPSPDHTYVVADFGQQEPRILAQISQDPKMIYACNTSDVYSEYAKMLNCSRFDAKTSVLAISYGGYWKTLVERGIEETRAKEFESEIKKTFVVAMQWGKHQLQFLLRNGYVKTLLGRRTYYPNAMQIKSDGAKFAYGNNARNTPIQGSAADMTKMTMVKINDVLEDYGAHIVLQIHDELVIEVPIENAEEFKYQVIGAFESAGRELCPDVLTPADVHIMDRWDKV